MQREHRVQSRTGVCQESESVPMIPTVVVDHHLSQKLQYTLLIHNSSYFFATKVQRIFEKTNKTVAVFSAPFSDTCYIPKTAHTSGTSDT